MRETAGWAQVVTSVGGSRLWGRVPSGLIDHACDKQHPRRAGLVRRAELPDLRPLAAAPFNPRDRAERRVALRIEAAVRDPPPRAAARPPGGSPGGRDSGAPALPGGGRRGESKGGR